MIGTVAPPVATLQNKKTPLWRTKDVEYETIEHKIHDFPLSYPNIFCKVMFKCMIAKLWYHMTG